MKGILGRKVGMTEKFTKDGKIIPVTVVAVEPNVIMQIKTVKTDGYNAIQLGFNDKKEKRTTKAELGHAKKANVSPKRFLKEIKVSNPENYELGSTIKADIFEVGEKVDVQGTSKGKGFAGVIKRHHQSRGPESHGSRYHRRPGSMGPMRPMRVLKGKNLAGHMGFETKTIQNLTIIDIDLELNYILVSGNIPGAKNSLVLIKEAIKGGKKETFELVSYESVSEETSCTCTDACTSGSNPDCTCESDECHCKELKEVEEITEEKTQTEEVKEETSEEVAEVTEEVTVDTDKEVIEETPSEEESK